MPMETTYTIDTMAEYKLNTMTHWFWAWGERSQKSMRNSVGKLRVDYHISFTGHPTEEPDYFEMVVPLVVKSYRYTGL